MIEIIITMIIIASIVGIWGALYWVREKERASYIMATQKRKEIKAKENEKLVECLNARPKTTAFNYRAGLKMVTGKDGAQQMPGIAKGIISNYSHHFVNIMSYMHNILDDANWWKYDDIFAKGTPTIQYPIGGNRRIIAMQSMAQFIDKKGFKMLSKAVLTFWIKGWVQSDCDATLTKYMKVKFIIQDMGHFNYRRTVMFEYVDKGPKIETKEFRDEKELYHHASSNCAITFDYLTYALICINEIKDARENMSKERDPYPFKEDVWADWPSITDATPWDNWGNK